MALGTVLAPGVNASRRVGALIFLLGALVGCAGLPSYHQTPVVTASRLTVIENFSTHAIDPEAVDGLLLEVAEILDVRLDSAVPPPRIVVTEPGRIAELYDGAATRWPGDSQAMALYFPGRRLILIPYFDRILLGHELAHYLTEYYLSVPRTRWEAIALDVERRLTFGTQRDRAAAAVEPVPTFADRVPER